MSDDREVPGITAGIGAGPLSDQASQRLQRPSVPAIEPPAVDDLAAVARWRASMHEQWLAGDPSAEACGHHEVHIAGVRCLRAGSSPQSAQGPLVVYCHGGGYVLGSPEVALPITERLASAADVVSVDYRLAPEHPFPAAVDDCFDVYRSCDRAGPVVLAGDSAGSNLVVALTQRCLREGFAVPAGLVLLSPHLEHARSDRGQSRKGEREDVDAVAGDWLSSAYCGAVDRGDPAVSPLRGRLGGLPPTLVQVGSDDSSMHDAVRFARIARRAGVMVTLDIWQGMWHTWHYHRDLPEADQALEEVTAFVSGLAGTKRGVTDG